MPQVVRFLLIAGAVALLAPVARNGARRPPEPGS